MRVEKKYFCEFCGSEFDTPDECKKHENESHCPDLSTAENEKIAEELDYLSDCAYGYRIDDTVLGYPLQYFENLLNEAARRLRIK